MTKLKPCPFCGGEVRIDRLRGDEGMYWWFITRGLDPDSCECRLCMTSEPFFVGDGKKEKADLVKAWNRRVKDERTD